MQAAKQFVSRVPVWAWFLVLAFITYIPCLRGDFFWDDVSLIQQNGPVNSGVQGLIDLWTRPGILAEYYPLTHTTYWVENQTIGLSLPVLHGVNILLLGCTGWALWALFSRLRVPFAAISAALFVVNPIHVESVAWMSQRKTVLSGLFYVLAALAYFKFKDGSGRNQYYVALVLFACALLSKTAVLGLPVALLIVNWWREKRWDWSWLKEISPFVALSALSALLTVKMEQSVPAVGEVASRTILDKLDMAGVVPFQYFLRLLWPFSPNVVQANPPHTFVVGLALLLALGVVLWIQAKKGQRSPFAVYAYYLVSLGPILGLIYFPYMAFSYSADRFQYIADMGAIPGLVVGVSMLARRLGDAKYWTLRIATVVGVVWAAFSAYYCTFFRPDERTWNWVVAHNPSSWVGWETLGYLAQDAGNPSAREYFQKAYDSSPMAIGSGNALALQMIAEGKVKDGQDFLIAMNKKAPDGMTYSNLGISYIDVNNYNEAVRVFEEGLRFDPTNVPIMLNLATIYATNEDKSIRNPERALELGLRMNQDSYTQSAATLTCLGDIHTAAGRKEEARVALERARKKALESEDFDLEAKIGAMLNALDRQ